MTNSLESFQATLRRMSCGVSLAAMTLMLTSAANAAELKLTRVVLSNAGLGQFTRSGTVAPGTNVDLEVRLDQVDDVLKTLTIFDKAGAFGTVSLPGKSPLTELFRDLPFGPQALSSQSDLLNALVGSEIEIEGPVAAKGRIFRVEADNVALPNNGGVTVRHRVTLIGNKGFVQAILEDVTALRFTDVKTQAQIARAMNGLAESEAKDQRLLSISFAGAGERQAAISYVVTAPIWKTTYRLVLNASGTRARLQGWALLENLTGGDWENVDLTLVSGNPISFHQPLYTALFAERAEIPVETTAPLLPEKDSGEAVDAMGRLTDNRTDSPAPKVAEAPMLAADLTASRGRMALAKAAPAAPPPPMATAANAASVEEAATQLLFQFPAKVSLANGRTLTAPILDREVAAERVWLYQPHVSDRHPFFAARLHNDGESAVPQGLVTAFETGTDGQANFVGDARMPTLDKGGAKFVTFALDARTNIRREDKGIEHFVLGKAAGGVLTYERRSRRVVQYEITAPGDEDRAVVIEEPRENGWAPTRESAGVETTTTEFRLPVTVSKGKTTAAKMEFEHIDHDSVQLDALAANDILVRLNGLHFASPAVKAAIASFTPMVGAIEDINAQRAQLAAERKKIGDDQTRIRENVRAIGATTDLGRRYLDTLKTQEDRLAEIGKLDDGLERELVAKKKTAVDFVRQLTLD